MIEVGNIQAEPGEFKKGSIEGVDLNTTDTIDIPAMVMNGAEDGPTFLLFSTQHGIELQGTGVIHKLLNEELDPNELSGAVIGIPIANPLAYMHQTYRSWIDNRDVGYETTTNPEGNTTERLANRLWEEAWSQADLIANIHCNVRREALIFNIIRVNDETESDLERMAESFGVTTVRYESPTGGAGVDPLADGADVPPTLRHRAAANGIPEITLELAHGRWISEPNQTVGVEGYLNMMKEFDMLEGEPQAGHELMEDLGVNIVPCRYTGGEGLNRFHGLVTVDSGGIFHPLKSPGELIEEDEPIAEIVDLYGDTREVVTMPTDGYIWAYPGGKTFATSGGLQTIETGGNLAYTFTHEDE